jgi:hypothetical protein
VTDGNPLLVANRQAVGTTFRGVNYGSSCYQPFKAILGKLRVIDLGFVAVQ